MGTCYTAIVEVRHLQGGWDHVAEIELFKDYGFVIALNAVTSLMATSRSGWPRRDGISSRAKEVLNRDTADHYYAGTLEDVERAIVYMRDCKEEDDGPIPIFASVHALLAFMRSWHEHSKLPVRVLIYGL